MLAALHAAADLVGAGGVDQQGELVEAGLGVVVGVGGSVTPTSTICSRIVRSISVAPSASSYLLTALRSRPFRPAALRSIVVVISTRHAVIVADERRRTGQRDVAGSRLVQTHLGIAAVHVHDDFRCRRRHEPQHAAAHAARAGAGAAGLGDAGAPFVHPHRDGVRLGPGLDDLEVDVGHLGAEREQVDADDVLDADDGVRVADAEVGHGPVRIAAERRPTRRRVDRGRPRPCRRWPRSCRVVGAWTDRRPAAGRRR